MVYPPQGATLTVPQGYVMGQASYAMSSTTTTTTTNITNVVNI
jgi:hypothetical protein